VARVGALGREVEKGTGHAGDRLAVRRPFGPCGIANPADRAVLAAQPVARHHLLAGEKPLVAALQLRPIGLEDEGEEAAELDQLLGRVAGELADARIGPGQAETAVDVDRQLVDIFVGQAGQGPGAVTSDAVPVRLDRGCREPDEVELGILRQPPAAKGERDRAPLRVAELDRGLQRLARLGRLDHGLQRCLRPEQPAQHAHTAAQCALAGEAGELEQGAVEVQDRRRRTTGTGAAESQGRLAREVEQRCEVGSVRHGRSMISVSSGGPSARRGLATGTAPVIVVLANSP
jgi:hypothetical protein